MALMVYNSLTKKKELLKPGDDNKIGIYVCGVTVYDQSHLGHAKSAINFDLVVRYLRHKGYKVKHVTNFTDVDDKIIGRANELGIEPLKLSKMMIDDYFRDMDLLKIKRADVYPKASETIEDIIAMIGTLVEKDYAYESNGSVYFSVRKVKDYGKLSGQSLDQMMSGARIEPGEDKRDPMDFALWKAAKPGEVSWDSPWGKGRPGWHIECSAMCLRHLGKTVDIHGGGTELVFPHHENEILQSEAHNDAPFVRYWMHNGLLMVDEEKMSKSLKNFFLISELLKKHRPEVIRFYLLNASYRQPLDYDERSLEEAAKALEKLQNSYDTLKNASKTTSGSDDVSELCETAWARIEERLDDDFSSREAIAAMFDLSRDINRLLGEGGLSAEGVVNAIRVFSKFNELFDVIKEDETRTVSANDEAASRDDVSIERAMPINPERISDDDYVTQLVRMRERARREKDYAYADSIRDKLAEFGIEIRDSKEGAVWKRK